MKIALSRTRVLLAVLLLVVLLQLFPERATRIKLAWVSAAALYVLAWAVLRFRAGYLEKSRRAADEAADAAEYQRYREELDVLRARFDPQRDLSDPTSISPEYQSALAALHERYQAMLDRKFGPRR